VQYPDGCKDLNEVLVQYGEQAVRDCVESARGYPVEGIYNVRRGDLVGLRDEPRPARYTLGVEPFDEIFGVRPGQVMLVTGVPGDGKSSFVDYLTVQLTKRYGWRWAVCSPEHDVRRHAASIAEKYAGQPFYAYEPGQTPMTDGMVNMSEAWVGRNYSFILQEHEDKPLTIDFILDRARTAKIRDGIQGLVIDPYNELEHERGSMTEAEYAGVFLSRLRKYARASDLFIIIVAHPAKMQRDQKTGKRPVPTPYDVQGSSHWYNKPEVCMTVHRPDSNTFTTDVYVQKMKWKEQGGRGQASFRWDKMTGLYYPLEED
jgi:twinkle protein